MTDLQILKGCELHVHSGGCITAVDLLEMGRDHYQRTDWTLFLESYTEAFGYQPDPHQIFEYAIHGGEAGFNQFKEQFVFGVADGGDFGRFQAKFDFLICVLRHYRDQLNEPDELARRALQRHQQEGLDYVAYRALYSNIEDVEDFMAFHGGYGRIIQQHCTNTFTARYIPSLPRDKPMESYRLMQRLFDDNPDIIPTIVGMDFCAVEEGHPPSKLKEFFAQIHADNVVRPERTLEVAYHVGESYFDKSVESAIRWCHEVSEMGAKRLGHATALGLDPAVAITRRPEAHVAELVSERLAQIGYDLVHRDGLEAYGVSIDTDALQREQDALGQLDESEMVKRPYTSQRLIEARRRQDFVLDRLTELETVIETCPTSNLTIGGVPSPEHHPVHRFLKANVNLVICADDPGIFDSPLSEEVNWVLAHTSYDARSLVQRLGDPRRFRFGQTRP